MLGGSLANVSSDNNYRAWFLSVPENLIFGGGGGVWAFLEMYNYIPEDSDEIFNIVMWVLQSINLSYFLPA